MHHGCCINRLIEQRENLLYHSFRQSQTQVGGSGCDRLVEMLPLLLIDSAHSVVGTVGGSEGMGHIGQAVAQLDERCIGRGAYASVIVLASSLSPRTAFVISQRIDHFSSHVCLRFSHKLLGHLRDIVVSEASILYAVVIVGTEDDGQNILIFRYNLRAILHGGIGHHPEVVTVRKLAAVSLAHRGVKGKGSITYRKNLLLIRSDIIIEGFLFHIKCIIV